MPSSYTTSLKIQEIAGGEQSGYWGTTTNTNWTLIEQAVAGVETITMSNSDYTLSNLNGVLDEARNMVLVVNGTNSGIRQIIAPLVPKFYVIRNATVGGYAITIGGATGSVITIPNGVVSQVYCDGSNFYSAQTGSAGNFNVNGDLTVGGNAYGTYGFDGTTQLGQGYGVRIRQTPTNTAGILQFTNYAANTQLASINHDGSNLNITSSVGGVNVPTVAVTTNDSQAASTSFVRSIVPSGVIVMWSGSIASIPSGWYLCDGTNSTPDLRSRFIVGAGSTYAVNATGGSADAITVAHSHSISDPGHNHTYPASGKLGAGSGAVFGVITGGDLVVTTSTTGITATNSTGSTGTNANLPPYLALAYIMKA